MNPHESRAIAELVSELKALGKNATFEAGIIDQRFPAGHDGAPGRMAAELRGGAIAFEQAAILVEQRLLAFTSQDVLLPPAAESDGAA